MGIGEVQPKGGLACEPLSSLGDAGGETIGKMRTMPKRTTIATGLIVLLLGALAAPASAHAAYKESSPADGSTVSAPPTEVWAEFTEPPESSEASRLEVYDPCGARVDSGGTQASGYRMTTAMTADKQGEYTVLFQVVSALDGHPTKGQFTFTSTSGEPCPGSEEEPEPSEPDPASDNTSEASDDTDQDEPFTVAGGGGDQPFDPVDALKHHTKKKAKDKDSEGVDTKQQKKEDGEDSLEDAPVVQAAETPPTTPASDSQKVPMDWLLASLGVAALIGAAGGQIYVNLLGPKR